MKKLITIFIALSLGLLNKSAHSQSVVRRNASRNTNNSLSVKIKNALTVRSSATTSGNTKIYTEAKIGISPGSEIETRVGGEDGISTINLESGLNTNQFEATGFSSQSNYILDDSSLMNSQIETLDEQSQEGGSAEASSDLIQETTLDIKYQNNETLSTFQQAF